MRKFLNLSIRSRLIISFVLILLIPSLIIGWTSYSTAKRTVEHEITMSALEDVTLLNSVLDRFIEPEIMNIDYLSDEIAKADYTGDNPVLQKGILAPFLSKHPEISTIYVGSKEGMFINAPAKKMPEGYDPRERPWYQEAMKQTGKVVITSPFESKTTGDFVFGVAKVLKDGSGVLAAEVKIETISEIVNKVHVGDEGYAFLADKDKKVIVHPTAKPTEPLEGNFVNKIYQTKTGNFEYTIDNKDKKIVFATNELTGWKVAGTLFNEEITKAAQPIFNKTILVLSIALILGIALGYLIIASITKPLRSLVVASEKIGQGDLTEEIQVQSNDELGQLGNSFNTMTKNLRELIEQIGTNTEQVAASAEELTANAEQTSKATEQIAVTIQEVAAGTDKQMESVEESSIQISSLAQEVQRISDNADSVSLASKDTAEKAAGGERSIKLAVNQMNTINDTFGNLSASIKMLGDRSNEINQIIEVITSIASQTNLLALNAAIEAARAGEHGKGFAVVAEEVRKLAEQSSDSSQQIAQLIVGIQEETSKTIESMEHATSEVNEGIGIVDLAGGAFSQIQASINGMAHEIEQISSAVQKITSGTEQVVHSVMGISQVAELAAAGTQNVSAATQEQLASMEEISASAGALSNMADELHQAIGRFKV
ncbi:methyl-accepting chemotaxis protein [Peribacillus glennii]|uniref:HAMP domain-containing protein n=1 Tax=Peribacillus glennii TaxID=2303991 RepID=A0A372L8D3_9BACI|nr:methyl-accepting chemotaxis protein [Peribacillus glennii]RFU61147.1 HAMP domain-containing protein [Peribacillus glennii]